MSAELKSVPAGEDSPPFSPGDIVYCMEPPESGYLVANWPYEVERCVWWEGGWLVRLPGKLGYFLASRFEKALDGRNTVRRRADVETEEVDRVMGRVEFTDTSAGRKNWATGETTVLFPDSSNGCPQCRYGQDPCVCPTGMTEGERAVIGAAMANLLHAADTGQITEKDAVTLPQHYARFKIEPINFICSNGLNFFQGNVIKYIMRWDAKNGLEDLRKAQRYLTMFIKFVEGDADWWRSGKGSG